MEVVRDEDANLLFETLFDIRKDIRHVIDLLEEESNGPGEEEES
jgi:hypothetical protein